MKKEQLLQLNKLNKGVGWYLIPRAQYFHKENIEELHRVFELLKQKQYVRLKDLKEYQTKIGEKISADLLVYREWDQEAKLEIFNQMKSEGIIKPYAKEQTINDQLANLRNYTNLLKKLGFGFFNKQKHLFISPTGEEFLKSENINEWFEVFEKQLIKLQFWNPSMTEREREKYNDFELFPYIFTLDVLLELDKKELSTEEFALFMSYAKTHKDKRMIYELINEFRELDRTEQIKLVNEAELTVPQIANAHVTMGLFGCTPSLLFCKNKIECVDINKAKELVKKYMNKLKFVGYVSFEDWYEFMGDPRAEITVRDGIQYYTEIGKIDEAKDFLKTYIDSPTTMEVEEGLTFEDMLQNSISERLIEDVLEKRVSLLEDGLRLIRNGRQYSTEIGRIDLLALDKNKNYVVIELKKGMIPDKVMGQTLRYMGWVRDNLSKPRDVRGIIVGREVTEKLKYAKKGMQAAEHLIKLIEFDVDVSGSMSVVGESN